MQISNDFRTNYANRDFLFFAETPVVYHCHHFNLFLDQTIDDAMGYQQGQAIRMAAAREASHQLISNVAKKLGAELPAEIMQVALELFGFIGHGKVQILADENGGSTTGSHLHYGYSWFEKYGRDIRRNQPADAFAAGYAAAAVEVAYKLPPGSMMTNETSCISMRDPACCFNLVPGEPEASRALVDQASSLEPYTAIVGKNEETIAAIADGLRGFTASVSGDERGLLQAFGVFVTMHLPKYYNRISYDSEAILRKKAPQSLGIFQSLLRESGHVCVFNTCGGILLSPEWEGMVGKPSGDIEETVTFCMAICRALGFGHWTIEELDPDKRFVLKTANTYESTYYLKRHGMAEEPNCYFVQGAALATMVLAHKLDWKNPPELNQKTYNALFRGGLGWKVREEQGLSQGAPFTQVIVERAG